MPVISTLAIFDRFHKKICRAISRPKRQGIFNGKYLQSWTKVSDFCPNPSRTSKSKKGIQIFRDTEIRPENFGCLRTTISILVGILLKYLVGIPSALFYCSKTPITNLFPSNAYNLIEFLGYNYWEIPILPDWLSY